MKNRGIDKLLTNFHCVTCNVEILKDAALLEERFFQDNLEYLVPFTSSHNFLNHRLCSFRSHDEEFAQMVPKSVIENMYKCLCALNNYVNKTLQYISKVY